MAQLPPAVRSYLEELLTAAGIPSMHLVRKQMLQELFERLNSFLVNAYIHSLSANDRATFDRMAAGFHPQDKLEQFLHDHVPNLQAVHTQALAEFRTRYLREVAAAQQR